MSSQQEVPDVTLAGGVAMPTIGLGTWELRGKSGYQAMCTALELGYRHLDTATMYRNEAEAGRAIRDSGLDRGEVFATTKMLAGDAGREQQVITASLKALGTDYVDLWLVHWPPAASARVSAWRGFLAARDAGLARAVGVSNYSVAQVDELAEATGEMPSVNQVPWSPPEHDPKFLAAMAERGIVIEGYSPLKSTNLRDPVLARIAARHEVTPAQVVLRWHLEHGIVVIPKSADRRRLADNLAVAQFSLSDAEVAEVDGLRG
ncbi:MAG: aldo/keto reductase [Actinomycetota bacterium]